jgi:replicative DNA helicase
VGVDQIRMRVRILKQREPTLGLVVVDYVQLCRVDVPPGENRATAMGQVSRGLKLLAREQDVCVIALSQVNRNCESREDKRPTMGDLRESGNLEQDADIVALLYRDEVYNEHSAEKGIAEIIVSKIRKGTTGKVRTAWLGNYQRFASLGGYEPPRPPPLREVPKRGHNGKAHYTEDGDDEGRTW